MRCPNHPDNVDTAARMARTRQQSSLSLPTRSRNDRNPLISPSKSYKCRRHLIKQEINNVW